MRWIDYIVRDRETCDEQHAITDVYCASRRSARVQFPMPLLVGIVLSGVALVLVTGFIGYANCLYAAPDNPRACWSDPWYGLLFLKDPWPLYIWLSGLMVLLQVSIFRNEALLRRLIATLVATVASILVVGIIYIGGSHTILNALLGLLYHSATFTVLNFGLILAFLLDSARRWATYGATELNPLRNRELASADPNESMRLRRAKIGELISGDLIAGMLLCAVLSIIFTDGFMRNLLALAGTNEFTCGPGLFGLGQVAAPGAAIVLPGAHTVPPYSCPIPAASTDAAPGPLFIAAVVPVLGGRYINVVDTFLAGLCFVPGMLVLANTAFIRGLDPLSGAAQTGGRVAVAPVAGGHNADADIVAGRVGNAVFDALREALGRYILPYLRRAVLSLRNILWPLLVLVGSASLALCALYVQHYLHHYDPTYACAPAYVAKYHLKPGQCQIPDPHSYLGLALVFGVVGFLCTVFSAALLLMSGRVVTNTLRLLGRVGSLLLFTFWMFSFALFGFNWFLLETTVVPHSLSYPAGAIEAQSCVASGTATWQLMLAPPSATCSQPFGLGWLSAVSFVALIAALVALAFRLRGWRTAGRPARARAGDPDASTVASFPGLRG
jgi:hypothetical protein